MNRILIVLLMAGVAALRLMAAEPAPAYTLQDCLRIGLERAATIRNAKQDELIADARIDQIRSEAIPQAGLTARYARQDDVPETSEGDPAGRRDAYAVSAEASQLLYAGGKISTALNAARLYRDASSFATQTATASLIRDIHRGFHQVLLTGETAMVATQSVEQLRLLVAQSEQKHTQGVLPEFELLSARVRLANEVPHWIEARNQYELAKAAFANLLHLEAADFTLTGEADPPSNNQSLEALTSLALSRRPELDEMSRRVELYQADIDVVKSGRQPEFHAFAAYNGNNPDFYQPARDAWEWRWQAGVRMSWTPFDGGLRSATVRQKTAEWDKIRTAHEELRNAIRLEVRQAWLVWRHALEALDGARGNVALAERAQQIATVRQKQGLSTYLEFTESNLALSTARLAHLRARHARAVAETEILYASGQLTEPHPLPEKP
jgi:outer membrane protein TolC